MDNRQAYNIWAEQYDTNINLTRDLEAVALKETLNKYSFTNILEVGCGTGKNSEWLIKKGEKVVAVDFSEEMLAKAKAKITSPKIEFIHVDITNAWNFTSEKFDLITFSLVLEHIQDLSHIFKQVRSKIASGGYIYIGELHPFKQYSGSLARFDIEGERVELNCFTHHISHFIVAANNNGFSLIELNEWFDDETKSSIPRILTLLFRAV